MKKLEVAAAVIIYKKKILCVQRGTHKFSYISNKYEFPGGQIQRGESEEEALIREIKEELNMDLIIQNKFLDVNHEYPDFRLYMHVYKCTVKDDCLDLIEHIEYKWLNNSELNELDWAGADIPVVAELMKI